MLPCLPPLPLAFLLPRSAPSATRCKKCCTTRLLAPRTTAPRSQTGEQAGAQGAGARPWLGARRGHGRVVVCQACCCCCCRRALPSACVVAPPPAAAPPRPPPPLPLPPPVPGCRRIGRASCLPASTRASATRGCPWNCSRWGLVSERGGVGVFVGSCQVRVRWWECRWCECGRGLPPALPSGGTPAPANGSPPPPVYPHLPPCPQEVGYAITRLPEGFTPHRQVRRRAWVPPARPRCSPSLPACLHTSAPSHPLHHPHPPPPLHHPHPPPGPTPQIAKVYEARRAMIDSGEGVDWGMAEALAFGTLLAEGALSGRGAARACMGTAQPAASLRARPAPTASSTHRRPHPPTPALAPYRQPRAAERAGRGARHVQPPAQRAARPAERRHLHAAGARLPRPAPQAGAAGGRRVLWAVGCLRCVLGGRRSGRAVGGRWSSPPHPHPTIPHHLTSPHHPTPHHTASPRSSLWPTPRCPSTACWALSWGTR